MSPEEPREMAELKQLSDEPAVIVESPPRPTILTCKCGMKFLAGAGSGDYCSKPCKQRRGYMK